MTALPLPGARLTSATATRRISARLAPAFFARMRLRSSLNTTSSTQCSLFSIPQWPAPNRPKSAAVPAWLLM